MTIFSIRNSPLILLRVGLIIMLVTSVALHAGVQPSERHLLTNMLLAVTGSYVLVHFITRQPWERNLRLPTVLVLALLILGWLAALFPESHYDKSTKIFLPLAETSFWPGASVDATLSIERMLVITGMLGAMLTTSLMSRNQAWRNAFLLTLVGLGIGVTIFALIQRGWGDVGSYWGVKRLGSNVFGPFWYHTNAGAFLNLCSPIAAAGVIITSRRMDARKVIDQFRLLFWILALVIIVIGSCLNVSKSAQGVFVLELLGILFVWFVQRRSTQEKGATIAQWITLSVFIVLLGTFASFVITKRWDHLIARDFSDGRWETAALAIPWIKEAGAFGYGPGTFGVIFESMITSPDTMPGGYWQHAHNDYLQTALEWGWFGLVLWLILACAIVHASIKRLIDNKRSGHFDECTWHSCVLIALLGIAVQACFDFPLQIFSIQIATAILGGISLATVVRSSQRHRRRVRSEG